MQKGETFFAVLKMLETPFQLVGLNAVEPKFIHPKSTYEHYLNHLKSGTQVDS